MAIYLSYKDWNDKLHNILVSNFETLMKVGCEFLECEFIMSYDVLLSCLSKLITKKYSKSFVYIDELKPFIIGGFKRCIVSLFGGKAYGLAKLSSVGLKIPKTFLVSVDCEKIDLSVLNNSVNYAVRSSADIEDGEKNSFAGLFDSYLDVEFANVEKSVELVKASINNDRVKNYISKFNLQQPRMAVVIQEYKQAELSGVWLGKTSESGILEWVQGCGEDLVLGKKTPNTEMWKRNFDKNYLRLNGEYVGKKMLNAQKKLNNSLADIEWCILNGELVFLQFRPVTKVISKSKTPKLKGDVFKGIGCSEGVVEGVLRYVSNIEEVEKWEENDILFVEYTSPEWLPLMIKSKAIVSRFGGFLCHAGIIAREFDIPCVCGVEKLTYLMNGKKVYINGSTGEIKLIN